MNFQGDTIQFITAKKERCSLLAWLRFTKDTGSDSDSRWECVRRDHCAEAVECGTEKTGPLNLGSNLRSTVNEQMTSIQWSQFSKAQSRLWTAWPPTLEGWPGSSEINNEKCPCTHPVLGTWSVLTDCALPPRPHAPWSSSFLSGPLTHILAQPGSVFGQCQPHRHRDLLWEKKARGYPVSCHICHLLIAGCVCSHLAVRAQHGLVEGSLLLNLIGWFSAAHKSVCALLRSPGSGTPAIVNGTCPSGKQGCECENIILDASSLRRATAHGKI